MSHWFRALTACGIDAAGRDRSAARLGLARSGQDCPLLAGIRYVR